MSTLKEAPYPGADVDGHRKHFEDERQVKRNGVTITVTPHGFHVQVDPLALVAVGKPLSEELLYAEIYCDGDLKKRAGFKRSFVDRDKRLDPRGCGLWVKLPDGRTLAELNVEINLFPFMKLIGQQFHVTENYVSVPPALTITDEVGAVWTLGMVTAQKGESPKGEFAFHVLRDGLNVGELASRIERKRGRIRIFTKQGWKVWTGNSFF